jgi:hypothetical protein
MKGFVPFSVLSTILTSRFTTGNSSRLSLLENDQIVVSYEKKGGLAVIYQDVVPTGDARLMGGA